ncbi:MAG: glycosyltransferase [bacterium]|nr:glycosyltransferase [bacterium]
MKISVVIPVRNRAAEIRRCLASVLAGEASPADYEVIVVDNGSIDATAESVRAAAGDAITAGRVRLIDEPAPNRCRARNCGAAAARGEWLAFLDSDCVAESGWLIELARAIEKAGPPIGAAGGRGVGVVAGAIRPAPPETAVEAYIARRRWVDQEKFLAPGRRYSPPFAATANLAIRRAAFDEVGGFDPALAVAGEDADWCWRAARFGWRLVYAPAAAVTHYHRSTIAGLWLQAYHYGIGNADLFAKWRGEWGARAWFEPRIVGWVIKALLKAPWAACAGSSPLERRFPFYDAVANLAMAAGRVRGGLLRGRWVA